MSRPVNSAPREAGDDLREAVARQGSFMQTMKAVAWSFFGVRKSSDQQKDVTQLNPVHVVVAGVLSAVVFVVVLVMLVKWVIASGVAA
jgi:Protein of unknown function (DUF2970)